MILINGIRKDAKEIPALKKRAVFELMPQFTDVNINIESRKTKEKRSSYYGMPTTYVANIDGDNSEVRYAQRESVSTNQSGAANKTWHPNKITFIGGVLMCEVRDNDLYWFLMNHPKLNREGVQNPVFRLVDHVADAKAKREIQIDKFRALSIINGDNAKDMFDLRRLYGALGLGGNVDELDDSQVTVALSSYAESDPKGFLEKVNSADIDIKSMLSDAQSRGVIKIDTASKKITWGSASLKDNGSLIVSVPAGRQIDEFFVEWLLRTDSSGVLNEIQILTEKKGGSFAKNVNKEPVVSKKTPSKNTGVPDSNLIERALAVGFSKKEIQSLPPAELLKKVEEYEAVDAENQS